MTTRKSPSKTAKALPNSSSFGCKGVLALGIAFYLWWDPDTRSLISEIMVPFFKHPRFAGTVGVVAGFILTALTIVGSSNASI